VNLLSVSRQQPVNKGYPEMASMSIPLYQMAAKRLILQVLDRRMPWLCVASANAGALCPPVLPINPITLV
jgi:hypothetical protein